ncbi:MAG: hypothetical protein IJU65_00315, partial [Desulfovibrio sp.]|nr:hypothetical protein [Desulfovibrio sp.]
ERRMGGATLDLAEAVNAKLGDDVIVVLQTGGTKKWQNEVISSKKLERYVIDKEDMHHLASLPQASMGNSETLASFLRFCREKYPADHAILIIWDHGGGSVHELAIDENFNDDGLTLNELRTALENAWTPDEKHPPLEIIGFDACLMATLDVANVVHGFARYMVASEDVVPGNGWEYKGFLTALAQNTSMDAEELGRHICDTYMAGCKEEDSEDSATMSVTDLSRLPQVNAAWNRLGLEAARAVKNNNGFYAVMGRHANAAENYSNSKTSGYSNMVDMGDYINHLKSNLPQNSQYALDALHNAIIYKVNGTYRKSSSGLSFYYPLDGGKSYKAMLSRGLKTSFLILQGLQLNKIDRETARRQFTAIASTLQEAPGTAVATGEPLPPAWSSPQVPDTSPGSQWSIFTASGAQAVLASLQPLEQLDISSLEDAPLTISAQGDATLTLGPEKTKFLSAVYFYLALYSKEDEVVVILGKDGDIQADWEHGIFRDNYRNTWAALDGHQLYLDITHMDEEKYRYNVPAKLNGERVFLDIIYSFETKSYKLLGARNILEGDIPDKFLRKVKVGDEITTIFPFMRINAEDDEIEELELETFKLSESSTIEDADLGDGNFVYMFEMNDVQGNTALSQMASIEVKDGQITIAAEDDE